MKYGADISHHQTSAAAAEIIAGGKADFIITRASIGSYTTDSKLPKYLTDIQGSGIKNSHYCASYAKDAAEAVEEADFIVSLVKKYSDSVELPIFFDWEYFSANYIKEQYGITATPALVQQITEAFCERVKEHGYKAGVYFNKDYLDRFYTKEFFNEHPDYWRWYARPGYSSPDYECELWQYASDNGADFGYTGGALDKNILYAAYLDGAEIETMKPLSEGCIRMIIGPASSGDRKNIVTKVEGLGVAAEIKDDCIITGLMSKGDQCYIMTDCNALGLPYGIYEEPKAEPENPVCLSCSEFEKLLKEKEAELVAEHDAKVHLQQQADKLLGQVENLQADKQSALDALCDAEKRAANYYSQLTGVTAEKAKLAEQLDTEKKEKDGLQAEIDRLKTEIELYEDREKEESAASLLFRLLRKILQGG